MRSGYFCFERDVKPIDFTLIEMGYPQARSARRVVLSHDDRC
jgi:hypothetical protein